MDSSKTAALLRALLIGGLIAGLLDILFAIGFAASRGTAPIKLLQIVASGAFGKAAFEGGTAMAVWGLGLHFVLSFVWAALFLAAATLRPALLAVQPWLTVLVFGLLVFLVMRLVVLPLSAFPFPVKFNAFSWGADLLSHIFLFALPIAWAARKALS